ncbi:MAG: aspartyl protease family protein [Dehalococcoidia bacterium]
MKTGIVFPGAEGRTRHVGYVRTRITITNSYDRVAARHGRLHEDAVRSVVLDGVLVDTGANLLCLPANVVTELGLEFDRDVVVNTATGFADARVFSGARMEVDGRGGNVEVLEFPGGNTPLLGVIPLQALGLELDLQNERLIILPDKGPDTYFSVQ